MTEKDLEKNLDRLESARLEAAKVAVWVSTIIIDDQDYNNRHYYTMRDAVNNAYDAIKEAKRMVKIEFLSPRNEKG